MRRGRVRLFLAISLTLAMLLAACSGAKKTDQTGTPSPTPSSPPSTSSPSADSQTPKDTLVVAVEGGVDTFDPAFTVGSRPSQTTLQNVFDQLEMYGLQKRKASDGYEYLYFDVTDVQGMLTKERIVKDDGRTIVWKLREGAKFHNGNPVTAQAVYESYKRLFETKAISYWLLSMGGIDSIDFFTVVDEHTIEMRMPEANNLVLLNNIMHNTAVLDPIDIKKVGTASDPWALDHYKRSVAPGNGPFKFVEYRPDDRIVLARNDDYHGQKSKLAQVIMKIVPDATQRITMLKRGEIDFVERPPINQMADLEKDPNVRVLSVPTPRITWLGMNHDQAPWKDNKTLREAVALAVPYDAILKQVYQGYGGRATSLVGDGMPGHIDVQTYQQDFDKAKNLLAEAGYADGKGLPALKLAVRIGEEEQERSAILIANALKQVGLNVTVEKVAFASFNEQLQGGRLNFYMDSWISWVNDPWYHLTWITKSDSPSNYARFKNARIDELQKQWTVNADAQGRLKAAEEAQQILAAEVAHIYLVQPNFNVAMRKNVQGYAYLNDELPRYVYMYKD